MAQIDIRQADITRLDVDAIVNAANEALAPGGGVCGAIHAAAGPGLARECRELGGCATGEAKITGGYDLPARHVIHAVGPVWHGGSAGEPELLASCYRRSIELAAAHGLETLAFPAISCGIFGYPVDQAARVAIETTLAACDANPTIDLVIFACFGDDIENAFRRAAARHAL